MAIFTASTIVRDSEGRSHVFTVGESAPEWVRDVITADIIADEDHSPVDPGSSDSEDDGVPIPPKAGPGSSAAAWAAYAKSQGFEVDAGAKASEIREALVEAGVPVE